MRGEVIECVECGRAFVWSYGEQRFYRERGLDQPKRCEVCRERRKSQRRSETPDWHAMAAEMSDLPQEVNVKRNGKIPRQPPRWTTQTAFRFYAVAVVIATALAVVLGVGFKLHVIGAWLISINLSTLFVYGYDKAIAGSERTRAPEKVLLGLALIGGTFGALVGMRLFRHKTAKREFQIKFWAIVLVQVVLIALFWASRSGG